MIDTLAEDGHYLADQPLRQWRVRVRGGNQEAALAGYRKDGRGLKTVLIIELIGMDSGKGRRQYGEKSGGKCAER
jgi:hypothetical protein